MDELRRRARALRNNATEAERHLWRGLRANQLDGHRFRRQMPIAGYIADFACPRLKLIVEVDGGQHADAIAYDMERTLSLQAHGFRVLRYWNDDVLLHTVDVLEDILRHVKSTPPQPSPSLREREGANA
jgi:very-short-patch-repair endonuclease